MAKKQRDSAPADPMQPDAALLARLGSLVVHAAEAFSPSAHPFDRQTFRTLLDTPEVQQWLGAMGPMLPRPRTGLDAHQVPKVHAVVYQDTADEWRWRAVAANGRTIADSAEGYVRRADCLHGLALVVQGLPSGRLVDGDGQHQGDLTDLPNAAPADSTPTT